MHNPPLDQDAPITLAAACRLPELSRSGKRPHVSTLHRWAGHGGNGIRGVVLRTWLVGGTRCTSIRAVREFLAATNGTTPERMMSPRAREKQIAAAERRLELAGI